jgi:hypothetical protein
MRKNIAVAVGVWFLISIPTGLIVGRILRRNEARRAASQARANAVPVPPEPRPFVAAR